MADISTKRRKTKGAFFRKYAYAFKGFGAALKEESSLVVHVICTIVVFITAGILHKGLHYYDWIILAIAMAGIITVELINTAIENIVDVISFKFSYNAKKIKDIGAAACLIVSLLAIGVCLAILIRALLVVIGKVPL